MATRMSGPGDLVFQKKKVSLREWSQVQLRGDEGSGIEGGSPSAPTLSEVNAGTILENISAGYVIFCYAHQQRYLALIHALCKKGSNTYEEDLTCPSGCDERENVRLRDDEPA